MKRALYIYSIIQERAPRTFLFGGLAGATVYTLAHKDISAVLSECSVLNFDTLADEELRELLTAHQRVNEELIKNFDVAPMAPGMIAESPRNVIEILDRAYLQFKRAFKKIGGSSEFAVQTFWNESKELMELVDAYPVIKQLKEEAKAAEGKSDDMEARIKLGKAVAEALALRKKSYSDEIEKSLRKCSYDIKRVILTDKNMISNLALLIEKSRERDLDAIMRDLGERYGDTLRFKYIGPMAPGSFAGINLSVGNFEFINNARETLGVPELSDLSEIKNIYLMLARKYHPDRYEYKNDPQILEEMTRKMKSVQEAYEVMESYCRTTSDFSPEKYLSFRREDIEKSLLVKENYLYEKSG